MAPALLAPAAMLGLVGALGGWGLCPGLRAQPEWPLCSWVPGSLAVPLPELCRDSPAHCPSLAPWGHCFDTVCSSARDTACVWSSWLRPSAGTP